jgi:hypothetical protein
VAPQAARPAAAAAADEALRKSRRLFVTLSPASGGLVVSVLGFRYPHLVGRARDFIAATLTANIELGKTPRNSRASQHRTRVIYNDGRNGMKRGR